MSINVYAISLFVVVGYFIGAILYPLSIRFIEYLVGFSLRSQSSQESKDRVLSMRCTECGDPIVGRKILSAALFRKCAMCGYPMPASYFVVEQACAVSCGLMIWKYGVTTAGFLGMGYCVALILLALICRKTGLLVDRIVFPILFVGLGVNVIGIYVPIKDAVEGMFLGFVPLYIYNYVYKIFNRQEGMGLGVMKTLAAIGAWIGVEQLVVAFLIFSVAGSVIGFGANLLQRKKMGDQVLVGESLALGGIFGIAIGHRLMQHIFHSS